MTTSAIDKPAHTEVTHTERTRARQTFRPNVDIIERDEELCVLADMPGSNAEDVDIRFENGTLTLFGKVADRQAREVRFLTQEYGVGDYLRTFQVSETIDAERIYAEFSDGVLTLHLPKTEKVKPRRIAVKKA